MLLKGGWDPDVGFGAGVGGKTLCLIEDDGDRDEFGRRRVRSCTYGSLDCMPSYTL